MRRRRSRRRRMGARTIARLTGSETCDDHVIIQSSALFPERMVQHVTALPIGKFAYLAFLCVFLSQFSYPRKSVAHTPPALKILNRNSIAQVP